MRILILLQINLFISTPVFSQDTDTLKILVGDTKIVSLANVKKLNISRKGIILIDFLSEDQWSITALKPGFVAVQDNSTENRKILLTIEVEKPQEEFLEDTSIYHSPICHRQNISCNALTARISGKFSKIEDYFHMGKRCRETEGCEFSASLDHREIKRKNTLLQRKLGKSYSINLEESKAIFQNSCLLQNYKEHSTYLDAILGGWISQGWAVLLCVPSNQKMYRLKALFIQNLQQKNEDKSFSHFNIGSKSEKELEHSKILSVLAGETSNSSNELLAKPEVLIEAGKSAQLHIGGEVLLTSFDSRQKNEDISLWKRYGMNLDLRVDQAEFLTEESSVSLSYVLELNSPQNVSSGFQLQGARLQNSSQLKLNSWIKLAVLQLDNLHFGETNSSWLGGFPIIGPLLAYKNKGSGESTLEVWVEIQSL
ncbi:MAG: hypothetical protein KBD78_02910 [Oligoflexales bacterium]|nr:hypothetical protein [Oligoflexales bacterium]